MDIRPKTREELKIMREAGQILQSAQKAMKAVIKAGISLKELDVIAENIILTAGAKPAFKGFHGFPATLCTMINSEVVHGIPDDRLLQDGDLISIDCGVLWKGLHSDAAFTVIVGGDDKNEDRAKFSACVKKALIAGCKAAKAGNRIGDIGAAIQKVVYKGGYSLCKEYTGHGLGKELHEDPIVFNYGKKGDGMVLKEGMTIAIEPIVASGNPQVKILSDDWTVVTQDGKDACQWEHCGAVTKKGLEIFA
jgi:methionyl aminopeptidase